MAVNHYSADSALRSLPALNTYPAKAGSKIPLEITCSPFVTPISKVPASPAYLIADNVSAYLGNADSPRRLAEHAQRHAKSALTRTFLNPTSID